MDGTAPEPTPATEPVAPEPTPAAPEPTPAAPEPTRPVLRAVDPPPPPARSLRDELDARRASAPAPAPTTSRVQQAREARKARKAPAPTPAPALAPAVAPLAPTATPATPRESKQSKEDRWARERVRIGTERHGWESLLQSTLTPMLHMTAHLVSGIDAKSFALQVPVLESDGSATTWRGPMDSGISVLLSQSLATAFPGGEQLEHPLAIPVVALLTVGLQFVQIVFMHKIGGMPYEQIAQATVATVQECERLEREEMERQKARLTVVEAKG